MLSGAEIKDIMRHKWEKDLRRKLYKETEKGMVRYTPADYLWSCVLGGCGCGYIEDFVKFAWIFFMWAAEENTKIKFLRGSPCERERILGSFMLYCMKDKKIIAHESNIAWSWLTPEGEALYEDLIKMEK